MPAAWASSWIDGDVDLLGEVVLVVAQLAQREPVDADDVGALAARALGVRHAVVQPEQVGLVGIAVGDLHDDVVEHAGQLVGQVVEGVGDEPLEAVPRDESTASVRRPSARG